MAIYYSKEGHKYKVKRYISELLREYAFILWDFLKGGKVLKNKREIEWLLSHPQYVPSFQAKKFQELANWATNQTVFYSKYKKKGTYSLKDFPIIDKNIIKENHEDLCSEFASKSGTIKMHTSGSTGTPLVIKQDSAKRNRVYAEMIYMWGFSGYKIGMRYAFLRRWNCINRKSKITSLARNLAMVDVYALDDNALEEVRNQLYNDKKVRMIIGYASTLDRLGEYLRSKNAKPSDFNIVSIISGSEVLTEKTRTCLKDVFGCNVVSLYSNQENGMLAVECNENKEFHMNTASYIFEILKVDSDEPANIGEVGRIVITDLFNFAMPIIRYDTGDLTIKKEKPDCVLNTDVVTAIEGRKVDVVYDTTGRALSPHTITNGLWRLDKLKQFQLIQKSKTKYCFKVNDPHDAYSDEELIRTCKEFFGEAASIDIERVDNIPVLVSGKFKYLICEI